MIIILAKYHLLKDISDIWSIKYGFVRKVGFLNPYAAGGYFGQNKIMWKKLKNNWNPG